MDKLTQYTHITMKLHSKLKITMNKNEKHVTAVSVTRYAVLSHYTVTPRDTSHYNCSQVLINIMKGLQPQHLYLSTPMKHHISTFNTQNSHQNTSMIWDSNLQHNK